MSEVYGARKLGAMIVIAKEPLPGRAKTRLAPALTMAGAARVAAAALSDTLAVCARVPAREHLLAFDGCADGWLPPGWDVTAQRTGGLDERLSAALAAARRGPAVLVGMDTPQLRVHHMTPFGQSDNDACLGLAADGGYWAIGLRDPRRAAEVIRGVPMSTDQTGAEQLWRLHRAGMSVLMLDELRDVDTIADALDVAAQAPDTAFAGVLTAAMLAGVR